VHFDAGVEMAAPRTSNGGEIWVVRSVAAAL